MSLYGDASEQPDPVKDQHNAVADQSYPQADLDVVSRLQTKTIMGAAYEVSLYEQEFKSAVSAWRKQFNRA